MPEARRAQARENVAPLKASLLGAGFPRLEEAELRDLPVPVLLLEGEYTHRAFRRVLDRLEELIPVIEREVVPDATHAREENPRAMSGILLDWISRH